ncbi:MAG TPA: hypothetical protein DEF06_04645, partial [Clostridiales bacterium]|nr:hypothetical protein [Clostridiales bacterium]
MFMTIGKLVDKTFKKRYCIMCLLGSGAFPRLFDDGYFERSSSYMKKLVLYCTVDGNTQAVAEA